MYVNDVKQKMCDGGAIPTIIKESVSTALVNGNNGLGPVVGNFCMDLAIKKAKETGIGWVCTRGVSCSHGLLFGEQQLPFYLPFAWLVSIS